MPPPRKPRSFHVNPKIEEGPPLCIGLAGPPGAGKTWSALRLARGMARIRGGKPVLIDTEAGRARKYLLERNPEGMDFDYIPFAPPFEPAYFLDAIREAAKLSPSAIIVDNASDEHEGPGGVLEWHDRNVPNMGGNEWAAWNAPKASRRELTTGVQQIKIPIIFTFRARPKTKTEKKQNRSGQMKETPVALGFMPVAGDELVGIMDLFCLLPPKSNGVAIWTSALAGEDFTIKLPSYLARYIRKGSPIDEDLGEALALWQAGDVDDRGEVALSKDTAAAGGVKRQRTADEMVDDYVTRVNSIGKDLGGADDRTGKGRDELRSFQMEPRTLEFVGKIRDRRPDLHDRIIEANSRRARDLEPEAEIDDVEDDRPAIEEGNGERFDGIGGEEDRDEDDLDEFPQDLGLEYERDD